MSRRRRADDVSVLYTCWTLCQHGAEPPGSSCNHNNGGCEPDGIHPQNVLKSQKLYNCITTSLQAPKSLLTSHKVNMQSMWHMLHLLHAVTRSTKTLWCYFLAHLKMHGEGPLYESDVGIMPRSDVYRSFSKNQTMRKQTLLLRGLHLYKLGSVNQADIRSDWH